MTYERVVVSIKSTGPDPAVHMPVEVAWWDLTRGERGVFVPAHHVNATLGACDLDTIEAIGYLERIARAAQDTDGHAAARLAQALQKAILVSDAPMMDAPLIRRMVDHYLNDVEFASPELQHPDWLDVLDVRSFAAGILGLDVLPDLEQVCQFVGVPLEAARTAETDVEAIGRCVLRLTELSADAGRHRHRDLVAAPSLAELGTALAEDVNARAYDLVTFGGNGQDDRTYALEGGQIAAIAVERFRPAYVALADEVAGLRQQLHETARASQNAGDAWRAEIDRLTEEVEQARAAKVSDSGLQLACEFVNAYQEFEGADSPYYAKLLEYASAARVVVAAVMQKDSEIDRLDKAWHAQADELQAARDKLAQLAATRWQETVLNTPWEHLVVPAAQPVDGVWPAEVAPEFEVGTQAPSPERAETTFDIAGGGELIRTELLQGVARLVSPIKGGCPNLPGCEHPGFRHDVEDYDDPIPRCGAAGCRCGCPPAGWRRIPGQRVFHHEDEVPAGVYVLARDGAVYGVGLTEKWVNEGLGPVVEVHAAPSPGPTAPPAEPSAAESARG